MRKCESRDDEEGRVMKHAAKALNRELGAAFLTAATQDFTPVCGRHTFSESVFALALFARGMVGRFHVGFSVFSIKIERGTIILEGLLSMF